MLNKFTLLVSFIFISCGGEDNYKLSSADSFSNNDIRPIVQDYKSSLVHYFKFDDNFTDYGFASQDIIPSRDTVDMSDGIIPFVDGRVNKALGFDGDGDHADFPLEELEKFTFSFWYYNSSASEVATQYALESDRFRIHDRGAQRTQFEIKGTGGITRFKMDSSDAYNEDEWVHITITADLSTPFPGDSTGLVSFYVNGTKVTALIESEGSGTLPNEVSAYIGNTLSQSRDLVGMIDEFAVFNRILTDEEVSAIHTTQAL